MDFRFEEMFRALSSEGYAPFPWQERLFGQLRVGTIPASLDLPTGLGKTKVMALWLLALATGADLPRRLVYVVDRRAVVDQASREAEDLARGIATLHAEGRIDTAVFAGGIGLSTLRGQHVDQSDWRSDPARPTIIVGTVDMIGSRLLFEGYGVRRRMRSPLAGLLGTDTLLVLDEAHLVPPFSALVSRISQGIAGGELPLPLPVLRQRLQVMQLSATQRGGGAGFGLSAEDRADAVVRRRIDAVKRVELLRLDAVPEAPEEDEKTASDAVRDRLAADLAAAATRLAAAGPARVAVFCDSRKVAEKVHVRLAETGPAELLVGARRVRERLAAAERLAGLGFVAGSAAPQTPVFLIATAAGEVGIDLDADHAVMDLVPWERMVQRLGRVNRRGEGAARVVLCDTGQPVAPDGISLKGVRALLAQLPEAEGGRSASPAALGELARCQPDLVHAASSRAPLRPALTRAELEAWALTGLDDHPGRPDIAPWLRGWVEEVPQTRIVWRAHLPVRDAGSVSDAEIAAFFDAAPVHLSEVLETESFRVRKWLEARAKVLVKARAKPVPAGPSQSADSPDMGEAGETVAAPPPAASEQPLVPTQAVAILLRADGTPGRRASLGDLAGLKPGGSGRTAERKTLWDDLPGATLILDARLGGLAPSGLMDAEAAGPALTADRTEAEPWGPDPGFSIRPARTGDEVAGETHRFDLSADDGEDDSVRHWLSVTSRLEQGSPGRGRPVSVTLADHTANVAHAAARIGAALGLGDGPLNLLAHAARLHDAGKAARVWQRAFGADRLNRGRDPRAVWAKSPWCNVPVLEGYRHEFGSLVVALQDPELAAMPEADRDLVLHLIAAHHGRARPVIGPEGCADGPPSQLAGIARDAALRMARLQGRWGVWGLAWWEAVFRAADQSASAAESGEGA